MKKIALPIASTYSMTFDLQSVLSNGVVSTMPDGKQGIALGSIELKPLSEKLNQARENGGMVIWASISVEHTIEHIIVDYLFGPCLGVNKPRDFFISEIIRSSVMSYAVKKKLVSNIINELNLLDGKQKPKLESGLKKIMEYRNAFAHGELSVDSTSGVNLKFYSGTTKAWKLDDNFWESLTADYQSANNLLDEARNKLADILLKRNINPENT
jgi:hypothetical protein